MTKIFGFDNETKAFMKESSTRAKKIILEQRREQQEALRRNKEISHLLAQKNPKNLEAYKLEHKDKLLRTRFIESQNPSTVYLKYLFQKNPQAMMDELLDLTKYMNYISTRKEPYINTIEKFLKELSLDEVKTIIDNPGEFASTDAKGKKHINHKKQSLCKFLGEFLSQRSDREQVAQLILDKAREIKDEDQANAFNYMLVGMRSKGPLGKKNKNYDAYLINTNQYNISDEVFKHRFKEQGFPSQQNLAFFLKATDQGSMCRYGTVDLLEKDRKFKTQITNMIINRKYNIEDRARVLIMLFDRNFHCEKSRATAHDILKSVLSTTKDFADLASMTAKLSVKKHGRNLFTDFGNGLTWNIGTPTLVSWASKSSNALLRKNAGLVLRMSKDIVDGELSSDRRPERRDGLHQYLDSVLAL